MTIFGTRPEIIRLSRIINQLDLLTEQILVHTGQNYDENLSQIFFTELALRAPDYQLDVRAGRSASQIALTIDRCDELFERLRPDRILILGDTNSGLAALSGARRGIPVYHLEAGNRSYDDRVPEELNRRLIDHCSTVLMPYTDRSKENLLREGVLRDRIFVVGNPIAEVLEHYASEIEASNVMDRFGVSKEAFLLATVHRSETVDDAARLAAVIAGLRATSLEFAMPLIVSTHPHTAERLTRFGIDTGDLVMSKPLGLWDFVKLERHAKCVLSDSGTVQEECSILGRPSVSLRDTTERAETIECGSSILAGTSSDGIAFAARVAVSLGTQWEAPPEYRRGNVSETVAKVVLGQRPFRQN